MSFDLNFCRQDGLVPAISEVKEYFAACAFFQVKDTEDGGVQFWYQNEATGVYCSFSYSPVDAIELEECGSSGLSFNLNYVRPSFFSYETMPLVKAFCKRFNLVVENPQEETLQAADTSRLIQSWLAENAKAMGAMVDLAKEEDMDLHYLPEARATEWWRYMRIRQKIEETLTEDMFVPSVITVLGPAGRLFTMIVWPTGIGQFFPGCEYVYVKRETKELSGTKEEGGLVAYDSLMESIGTLLDDYEFDGFSVKYLSPEKKIAAAERAQTLQLDVIDLSQHTRIASDCFHDVTIAAPDPGFDNAVR